LLDLYSIIFYPLIYIFPAYVANAIPVIFGGGMPLDFKKNLAGKRIFGDHKTIRGTLSGIIAGIIIGYIESIVFGLPFLFAISIALAFGAMFGDVAGSFVKRRMDVQPGASVPIMDQYGFFVFALIFAFPLGNLPSLYGILFLILITGALHLLMNIIAHKLKLKKVPW
jgi:CDP-2,3-bis-(O-geranylgeranyl)-sn-glycerol synthase